jgi:hypothetical protein
MSVDKSKDQDVFLKVALLPANLCLLSDNLASSSGLVVIDGGQQDVIGVVCADTVVIVFITFLNQSKLREKIYTDEQRKVHVGWQM